MSKKNTRATTVAENPRPSGCCRMFGEEGAYVLNEYCTVLYCWAKSRKLQTNKLREESEVLVGRWYE